MPTRMQVSVRCALLAVVALLAIPGLPFLAGCRSLQASAAKDPMKCERDPNCQGHQGKSADCATQCVDNIECMQRCRSVSGQR